MTDAPQEVVDELNQLARTRFELELERKAALEWYDTAVAPLKEELSARLKSVDARIDPTDARIWEILEQHRAQLVVAGKKSFATLVAKWQLKASPASTKVLDAAAIMKVARRFGVVKQIAEPPKREWNFVLKKFRAWLDKEPQMRPLFEDFIEETEAGETESLTIQNNGTYTVVYDGKRISPPSVSIKKKSSSPA